MRTVSVFRNNRNQAIRLPKEFEFPGVTAFAIERRGDALVLRPVRPNWTSFSDEPLADESFLHDRPDVIAEGRFEPDDDPSDAPP